MSLRDAVHAYRRLALRRFVPRVPPATVPDLHAVLDAVPRAEIFQAVLIRRFVDRGSGHARLCRALGEIPSIVEVGAAPIPERACNQRQRIELLPLVPARARTDADLFRALERDARRAGAKLELHAIRTLRQPLEIRAFVRWFERNTGAARARIEHAIARGWIAPGTRPAWLTAIEAEAPSSVVIRPSDPPPPPIDGRGDWSQQTEVERPHPRPRGRPRTPVSPVGTAGSCLEQGARRACRSRSVADARAASTRG